MWRADQCFVQVWFFKSHFAIFVVVKTSLFGFKLDYHLDVHPNANERVENVFIGKKHSYFYFFFTYGFKFKFMLLIYPYYFLLPLYQLFVTISVVSN